MNTEKQFQIEGMTCGGCVGSVERALKAIVGVETCSVVLATATASVRYDSKRVQPDVLRNAIEDAGFHVV
jgi:copper chaperone